MCDWSLVMESATCVLYDSLAVVIVESTWDMTDSTWDGSVLVVVIVVSRRV